MKILITICGRGGSKGIPGKNVKEVNGLPLIGYSIKTARAFQKKYDAIVTLSTDDEQIKSIGASLGLKTEYTRPTALATDTSGKLGVIKDVLFYEEKINQVRFDYLLDLDITSPLRTIDDLSSALDLLMANEKAINIFSVNPANRNPYFNMVQENKEGFYELVKKQDGNVLTRQAAPKVYDMNASFYFYKRSFFDNSTYTGAITDRSLIYQVPHICFDLDHSIDYEFLSFLMKEDKLDFWI